MKPSSVKKIPSNNVSNIPKPLSSTSNVNKISTNTKSTNMTNTNTIINTNNNNTNNNNTNNSNSKIIVKNSSLNKTVSTINKPISNTGSIKKIDNNIPSSSSSSNKKI
jgi:hypothetical protein